MAYEMTNVNTNQSIKTSSPPPPSSSSPPSFFTIIFEDGFIGMEIRNRRAVKNGAMVRKFHLNKDGRIGQAQATGKIKRYMQLLSVNDVDLTLKPFQECLETIKNTLRPMTIKFATKIDKRDLPSGVWKRALNRNRIMSSKKTNLFGLAKQFQIKFPVKKKEEDVVDKEDSKTGGDIMIHAKEHDNNIIQKNKKKQILEKKLDISKVDIEDDDWVGLVKMRKHFFNEQAKNIESELTIRLCHLCSKVDRFVSPLHRFIHKRCSKCGHEFGDFIPERIKNAGSFGKPAPVTSPEKRFNKRSQLTIQILAATFGILRSPVGTLDVTDNVEEYLLSSDKKILDLKQGNDILKDLRLEIDPAPGLEKCLHIRCCFSNGIRKYEILCMIDGNNQIIENTKISMPKTPWLRILENSYYGHPSDISKRYDISEIIQTMVDTKGRGCFLEFERGTDLSKYFGDP